MPVDTEEYVCVLRSTHDSSPVETKLTGRFFVGLHLELESPTNLSMLAMLYVDLRKPSRAE